MLDEPAALFLQIGLVTGELIEPFVDLQSPAILRDQVSAAIHCCAEILLSAGFQRGLDLSGKRFGRIVRLRLVRVLPALVWRGSAAMRRPGTSMRQAIGRKGPA